MLISFKNFLVVSTLALLATTAMAKNGSCPDSISGDLLSTLYNNAKRVHDSTNYKTRLDPSGQSFYMTKEDREMLASAIAELKNQAKEAGTTDRADRADTERTDKSKRCQYVVFSYKNDGSFKVYKKNFKAVSFYLTVK